MSSELDNILFKEYRHRVLGLLLLHPDQTYHALFINREYTTIQHHDGIFYSEEETEIMRIAKCEGVFCGKR